MAAIETVSNSLFQLFCEIVPLGNPVQKKNGGGKSKAKPEDVEKSLQRFYGAGYELRCQHKLGMLARARVLFTLQRLMLNAGYDPQLTRQVLFSLMVSAFVRKI